MCLFSTTTLQFFFFPDYITWNKGKQLVMKWSNTIFSFVLSLSIKRFWVYSKAKCTCYLQSWTSWTSSGVRCCYFIWCVTQTNVSHGRTTSGCLHIAKKRRCSLVNHPSKDGPCLPVPEGVMSTCTYFRTAKIIAVSTSSYHVPTPRRYYIQSTFHKVYV